MGQHLTPRFAHVILEHTCQWIPCFGYHDMNVQYEVAGSNTS